MKFDVHLDDEQINKIASITADKVLETVKYQKDNNDWYDREIKNLKHEIQARDSMIAKKDFYIERLTARITELRSEKRGND
ncbi:MAG: hypothetical protein LIR50_05815 [Bacillota bacterium]|nr:hypothetical protein [Bacillota bacterium]